MPRKKGTKQVNAEQLAQRLGLIREALSQCVSTSDIHELYGKQWGVVPRTIDGYIARVRKDAALIKLISLTPDQRATEQNLVVDGIKRSIAEAWARTTTKGNVQVSTPDLQRVQHGYELLGKIYGVFADRVELSGPGGGPVSFAGSPGLTSMLERIEAEALKRKAESAK